MIRLIAYVLIALLIAAGGWWLASQAGQVVVDGFGHQISVSLPVAMGGLILLTLALFLLWQLLVWLVRLPKRIRKMRAESQRERGYSELESALIAAAAGDTKSARNHADKVQKLMQRPALSGLLAARAAQADGDLASAERYFEGLLTDKRTRLAARRGLAETALQRHDFVGAIAHAREAFNENPEALWAFQTLFDALIAAHEWAEARAVLAKGERKGHVSKLVATRRRAVLLSAESAQLEIDGELEAARKQAEKAVSTAPGFAPGAALAARLLVLSGKTWRAAGLLEDAWAAAPHPALSLAYRDLKENESGPARRKRLDGFAELNPDHRESRILRAETALEAEDVETARNILDQLIEEEGAPSSRLCTLMARLESQVGRAKEAENWLRRSLAARDEPDWSDLDPEGVAFGYRSEDWARLVWSFGDAGELIHPRHERFERVHHGGEEMILLEDDTPAEPEPAQEEPAEKPEETTDEKPAPKKRKRKRKSKKTTAKKEELDKPDPEEEVEVEFKPFIPDDPGPTAKADPTESVETRKRRVH